MAGPVIPVSGIRERLRPEASVARGTALEVKDLSVSFQRREGLVRAVEGVSLQIADGGTLALVGESGSGKSVTSLALMRLLAPEARVQGQVFLAQDGASRGRMAASAPTPLKTRILVSRLAVLRTST